MSSGTGGDGARAIEAIKAERDVVMAQDEASAAFSAMPRAAIADAVELGRASLDPARIVQDVSPPRRGGPRRERQAGMTDR